MPVTPMAVQAETAAGMVVAAAVVAAEVMAEALRHVDISFLAGPRNSKSDCITHDIKGRISDCD
jgi:hypothetical protein